MKILIVINSLKFGGAEKQAVTDANCLSEKGHRVVVAYNQAGDLEKTLNKDIIKYRLKFSMSFISGFQLFCHLIFNNYSIIHAHMLWAAKVSCIPGKLTGHKVIFNEHGLGLWRRWYHRAIVRFISNFTDKVIASCDACKYYRENRDKINLQKLVTVYNSLEKGSQDNAITAEKKSVNKKFTIGFIGRFNKVKRLELFVEIARKIKNSIPDFRIVLVGDGNEKSRLEGEVEKSNLTNLFGFPGFVLKPKTYYKQFDVFVFPSKREAFSVALLEAGAFGIPTIAFNVGGNAEIIKDGITGYIIPENNVDLLIDRIIFLYQNPEKIKKMGAAAKKFITNNFSIENRIGKLEKLYQE